MSDGTMPRSLRLAPEEWAAFRRLQQELQARTPHATVTIRDAFRTAVASASAALGGGNLPVALTHPPRDRAA